MKSHLIRATALVFIVCATSTGILAQAHDALMDEFAPVRLSPVAPVEEATPHVPRAGALYDNGPLVNSPGTGFGGADESLLQQTSLGMFVWGFGHNLSFLDGSRIADDFTIPAGETWTIDTITFFAYMSGSPNDPSPITAVNLQIWNGRPGSGAGVIFGDKTTNRLVSTSWSGAYRLTEANTGLDVSRPVMASVVSVGIGLGPGTYWLDWQSDGDTGFSGPWAPPITITGQTTTGNALNSIGDNGATWSSALDNGTDTQQGFPFIVEGTAVGGPSVALFAEAFLEGPYDSGSMAADLVAPGGLPLAQPYSDPHFVSTPLAYNGTEAVVAFPPGTVDWVLASLRSSTSAMSESARRAGFVRTDGRIVDLDGDSLRFESVSPGNYYVVVCHRNHLCVMSHEAVGFSTGGTYDFTENGGYTLGPAAQDTLETSPQPVYGLFAADANVDGDVQALDFNAYILTTTSGASGYEPADFNMDGNVQALDFNLYIKNTVAGTSSQVP